MTSAAEAVAREWSPDAKRSKSDLTSWRLNWLEWFQLLPGTTVIDLKLSARLALRYASMSQTMSKFLNMGIVEINPGVGTLARELGVSERSIQSSLQRMEKLGALDITRTKGGSRRTNKYVLLHRNPAELIAGLDQDGTPQERLRGLASRTPQSRSNEPRNSTHENPAELIAEESPSYRRDSRARPTGQRLEENPSGASRLAAPGGADARLAPQKKSKRKIDPDVEFVHQLIKRSEANRNPLREVQLLHLLLKDEDVIRLCKKAAQYCEPSILEQIEQATDLLEPEHVPAMSRLLALLYTGPKHALRGLARVRSKTEQDQPLQGSKSDRYFYHLGCEVSEEFTHYKHFTPTGLDDVLNYLHENYKQLKQAEEQAIGMTTDRVVRGAQIPPLRFYLPALFIRSAQPKYASVAYARRQLHRHA